MSDHGKRGRLTARLKRATAKLHTLVEIETGGGRVPKDTADRALREYSEAAEEFDDFDIANTPPPTALAPDQAEALDQAIDRGDVDAAQPIVNAAR